MAVEKEKCSCDGYNLDRFIQPIILAILSKEPANGYAVIKKIPDYVTFENTRPDPTGVYRYLKMMAERGNIVKNEEDDRYSVTAEGAACLARWLDTLDEYETKIRQLTRELREGVE